MPGSSWSIDPGTHPHEAHVLSLDSSNAHKRLGWRPRWGVQAAVDRTIAWHQAWRAGRDMHSVCIEQLRAFGIEA
jgi:CDP-glucose 4,6-dehydratase